MKETTASVISSDSWISLDDSFEIFIHFKIGFMNIFLEVVGLFHSVTSNIFKNLNVIYCCYMFKL